ncbi:hypothetical protein ALC60_09821 [Trachymyrmex zeteki]|uniref:Uncharacterized protein n=1 Tax=Mycetomoellerius zeteki TaxID=64791 RepID=A0A151WTR3_9HYME|nr:hypothetical protein ALC60_09821 [Trachymyrmex zeteki]
MKRIERREKEERQVKINESRYNDNYKNIWSERLPRYLEGKKRMKDTSLVTRFICGNETKEGQYWREDEKKRCRICHAAEKNMTHILKECEETKSEMQMEEFIGVEDKGLETMKRIDKARKEAEERERTNKNEDLAKWLPSIRLESNYGQSTVSGVVPSNVIRFIIDVIVILIVILRFVSEQYFYFYFYIQS